MPRPKPRSSSTRPGSMPALREAVDQLVQAGDRVGRGRGERALEPPEHVGAGPRRSARAWTCSRTRPRISASEWPRSHFRRIRWMISWPDRRPVTSGTRWRNSRSTPRSSAWLTAGMIASASPPARSQPARRSSADSSATTRPPSAAAALSISTSAERRRRGSPVASRISTISPTWPIRIVASAMPGLGQRPIRQADHLGVGLRAAGADQLDADLGELAERSRSAPGSLSRRKTGPDMLTRQGRGGRPAPRCRPARCWPSARGGGRSRRRRRRPARRAWRRSRRRSCAGAAR